MKILSVKSTDKEGNIRDGVMAHLVEEQPGFEQKPALCGVRPNKVAYDWKEVTPDNFLTCRSCKKSVLSLERKVQQALVKKFETQAEENSQSEEI